MQPITLNQTGQFAIIQSNEPLLNVIEISNFYDTLTGVGQIIKEYSWSVDNKTWSYWSYLTQENLLALSSKGLLPLSGFYFRMRYTLATIGNMTISDAGINTRTDIVDVNKGYVPFGYSIGSMDCVECGNMRGAILNQCNATFNPYLVNPAIDIYKDLCYGIQNTFGLQVLYLRAKPIENSGDVIFKEWTLYAVEDAVCTKVLVPNNEFPDAKLNYNPYGIEYEAPFEVHIVKRNFEETFGPDAAPQSRDIVFFHFMPNRLFEVKSSTPHRDFMMQISYWKVDLMTYKSKADTYASDSINKMLDDITNDSYEAFGIESIKDTKDITKPQQYDRHIGTNLKDPIRKYINQDLKIITESLLNHSTAIADFYYDMNTIFDMSKNVTGIQYGVKSNFTETSDFAFTCWFKNVKPTFTVHEDVTRIISVTGNIVRIQIQSQRNYLADTYIQIYRQGKLNFYGKVINAVNNFIYDIEVSLDVISYLNEVNANWAVAPGWISKRCFPRIYIDGLSNIGTPSLPVGWKIYSFAERFFIVNINGTEFVFCIPDNIGEIWTGMTFCFSATFGQMNFSLWKIKESRYNTTELDTIYTKSINDVSIETKANNTEYVLPASNTLITNIRIFDNIIEFEKQSLILNQNIIQDSHHVILADNAYPYLKLPYIGSTK